MRTTPDNITELAENEIFVFGSNLAGRHGRGAALQAYKSFGAVYGVGEGLTGRCYAFPTLDHSLKQLHEAEIVSSCLRFIRTAEMNPNLLFLLTKVGCGLAGFSESFMQSAFQRCGEMPPNVVKPEGW